MTGQTLQQIVLNDKTLWLVAEPGEQEGALCMEPEDYAHGRESYAHLFEDGSIMRFQSKIGVFDDLLFTGVCQKVEEADDFLGNMVW